MALFSVPLCPPSLTVFGSEAIHKLTSAGCTGDQRDEQTHMMAITVVKSQGTEVRWAAERGQPLMDDRTQWRRVFYHLGPEKKRFAPRGVQSGHRRHWCPLGIKDLIQDPGAYPALGEAREVRGLLLEVRGQTWKISAWWLSKAPGEPAGILCNL